MFGLMSKNTQIIPFSKILVGWKLELTKNKPFWYETSNPWTKNLDLTPSVSTWTQTLVCDYSFFRIINPHTKIRNYLQLDRIYKK